MHIALSLMFSLLLVPICFCGSVPNPKEVALCAIKCAPILAEVAGCTTSACICTNTNMEDLQDCLNCFGESAISDDVISVAQSFNSDCAGTATVTADGSLQTFSGPDSSGNSVDDDGSRTTTGGTAGITSLITSTSSAKSARTTRGSVGSATGGTTSPAGNGTGTSNSLTSAEGGSSTRKKVNVVLLTPLSLVLLLWI